MPNTITELARRAHVSPATVSRVFSGQGDVSESTRAEILRIAKELNYAPKKYKKRNPASSGGNVIGMVIPDIRNSFYTEIIRAIEETLDKKGYELFVCDSNEDSRKEIRCLAALRQKQIGGLIITPVSDVVEYNADFLMEMNHMGIPVVLLDRDLRGGGLDGVFLDNFKGSYQATQVLVNQGQTHIGDDLRTDHLEDGGFDRLNGYLEALRENQIPYPGGVHPLRRLHGPQRLRADQKAPQNPKARHGDPDREQPHVGGEPQGDRGMRDQRGGGHRVHVLRARRLF